MTYPPVLVSRQDVKKSSRLFCAGRLGDFMATFHPRASPSSNTEMDLIIDPGWSGAGLEDSWEQDVFVSDV